VNGVEPSTVSQAQQWKGEGVGSIGFVINKTLPKHITSLATTDQ